jgi:dephospho-CoA kinase
MKILGLTGSIATGKTFVAEIFKQQEIKIFYSDIEIANLLKSQKIIWEVSEKIELASAIKDKTIDKKLLSNIVFNDLDALKALENILHPRIEVKIKAFINDHQFEKLILLDIPLLFEKNYQVYCRKVITSFCSEKTQKERAMGRKNLDNNRYNFIIKRQMPGNVKAALSDYLVYTDISKTYTKKQVEQILLKELA